MIAPSLRRAAVVTVCALSLLLSACGRDKAPTAPDCPTGKLPEGLIACFEQAGGAQTAPFRTKTGEIKIDSVFNTDGQYLLTLYDDSLPQTDDKALVAQIAGGRTKRSQSDLIDGLTPGGEYHFDVAIGGPFKIEVFDLERGYVAAHKAKNPTTTATTAAGAPTSSTAKGETTTSAKGQTTTTAKGATTTTTGKGTTTTSKPTTTTKAA